MGGMWKTDFTKIKSGSFLRANGGYLVLNALDVFIEPGVWIALKRTLRNRTMEMQSFDPFYLFASSALKPEPIDVKVKVVMIGDAYIYETLYAVDEDFKKIFKMKADFDTVMERKDEDPAEIRRLHPQNLQRREASSLRPERRGGGDRVRRAAGRAGRKSSPRNFTGSPTSCGRPVTGRRKTGAPR